MSNGLETLAGGVAVITGAGSGIGRGLAMEAAGAGMKVVLADIDSGRIDEVAAAIKGGGGDAIAVPTDVSKPEAIDALADAAYEAFGEVRLVVNNAGIETLGFSWEIPTNVWDKTLDINIHGVVHGVRAFAPRMIASGQPGFIANTASIGALGITPVQTAYIMSKHAVLAFSECLRLEMEVKKAPISVSAVLPGPVTTRIFTDSEGAADPVSQHHRQAMQAMLDANGIDGYEAAKIILPQIARGDFWVSTHPDLTREYAANRARMLTELENPSMAPELAATFEVG
jgi:NAD(P)-dependent dehydrogenase (short-subunit alcohol dehydrogenase family)